MSILRMIQKSGATKDGSIFSLKAYDYDIDQLKQIIKEKDVIIENNNEKIQELESHITELKEQCTIIHQEVSMFTTETNSEKQIENCNKNSMTPQLYNILTSYEKFISEITTNYEVVKEERDAASTHLAKLEFCFADLIEKYERLKKIVTGYQQNQDILLNHIQEYKNATDILEKRYEDLKTYANQKLEEASTYMEKNDKTHISEMAKVKSQLLYNKAKINDLEKKIALLTSNNNIGDGPCLEDNQNSSSFTPLSSLLQ